MDFTNRAGGIDRRILNNIRFNARRLALQQAVPGMTAEDLEQDLLLDLLRRGASFDPSRASFATFADRVVGHRVSTLTAPTLRLREERRLVSLDAPVGDDADEALLDLVADDVPSIADIVAIRVDVRDFVAGLSRPLLRCCQILLADNISEGAELAGIHRSTVYERAAQLKEEAVARGLSIYFESPSDTLCSLPVRDERGRASECAASSETGMLDQTRPKRIALLATQSEIQAWFSTANEGDAFEYFRGYLAIDRLKAGSRLSSSDAAELDRMATLAWSLAKSGLAHLFQRRHGRDDYSYLLVVASAGRSGRRS
jgi:hypothetical protein